MRRPRFRATSACNECPSRNAAVENTFVQFYPALLQTAAGKGTLNPSWVNNSARNSVLRPILLYAYARTLNQRMSLRL